jgi:hypothetical protein
MTELCPVRGEGPPPAEGEVGELVAALRADAECAEVEHYDLCNMTADQMRRAAELLQHLQPVPDKLPERLTVQEISDLPQHGENYIYSGDRSPDEIELDGVFSRADLQQLANSLSTSRSNSAMSDYYGGATLEDWLQEEVFRTREPLPSLVVSLFECWREGIEANIRAWMESDDGDGNHLSWRGWGRGFYAVADSDESRFDNAVRQGRLMISSNLQIETTNHYQSHPTPLSPAAQAVRQAAINAEPGQTISAALRAAADQVAPEVTREPHGNGFRWGGWAAAQGVRRDLYAIAAELGPVSSIHPLPPVPRQQPGGFVATDPQSTPDQRPCCPDS